jgi:hypothetical protein
MSEIRHYLDELSVTSVETSVGSVQCNYD